ncbi:MAG: helix-turn-helix domain-containing protein, partial [Pseudomonadota bacterium]
MAETRPRQPERIRAHMAASILGIETRTVQALAARGELPGAAKIGGVWTFDEAAIRNWIKERTTCQKDRRRHGIPTGAAIRSGHGSQLQA